MTDFPVLRLKSREVLDFISLNIALESDDNWSVIWLYYRCLHHLSELLKNDFDKSEDKRKMFALTKKMSNAKTM